MRVLVIYAALSILAGCATTEQRAAAVSRDVDDMMQVYGPGCERLGYTTSSDGWRECVLRLATKDQIEQRDLMLQSCYGPRYGPWRCGGF
jgi:hypothetical protein